MGSEMCIRDSLRALNSRFNETSPSLCQTKDGKFLFFSSDRPGGQGGYDIWVSKWDGAEYAWPLPLTGHSEMVFPVVGEGFVEGGILFVGDVLGLAHRQRFVLAQLLTFMRDFFCLFCFVKSFVVTFCVHPSGRGTEKLRSPRRTNYKRFLRSTPPLWYAKLSAEYVALECVFLHNKALQD